MARWKVEKKRKENTTQKRKFVIIWRAIAKCWSKLNYIFVDDHFFRSNITNICCSTFYEQKYITGGQHDPIAPEKGWTSFFCRCCCCCCILFALTNSKSALLETWILFVRFSLLFFLLRVRLIHVVQRTDFSIRSFHYDLNEVTSICSSFCQFLYFIIYLFCTQSLGLSKLTFNGHREASKKAVQEILLYSDE